MITIYHARRARSARIIWLLEELAVPYELEPIEFKMEVLRSPEYLQLHPLGLVPVVRLDGQLMIESGAILEFLLEKYGQGRLAPAPAAAERMQYLQWFHYGEASLAAHVSQITRMRFGPEEKRDDGVLANARENLAESLPVIERALAGREHICGAEFSAADIMVSYGLVMARILRELPADLPNIAAYLERLKQRPAYARAWA
jgi:glutathione S-transferase